MNLKRQLLLVSLLTLLLPWAGCEFIRETESALRKVQEDMLGGVARTLANSLAQYPEEFPAADIRGTSQDRIFLHTLSKPPQIDGYFDDWTLESNSLQSMRGPEGPIRFAFGEINNDVYFFAEVRDRNIVYATSAEMLHGSGPTYADRITLIIASPPLSQQTIVLASEAPGLSVSHIVDGPALGPEPAITAFWQDIPGGYRLEARIPVRLLGSNLGLVVHNTSNPATRASRAQSFSSATPGSIARALPQIGQLAEPFVPAGMRAIVTDAEGWRIAVSGKLPATDNGAGDVWSRRIYERLVEPGRAATFAEPDALGRERQAYVNIALNGEERSSWFRSADSGRAIVAAATPVVSDGEIVGALILQQGTDAILSLTNSGLARLINITMIATLLVAVSLLGYATWLSRRIRRLSLAAEAALDQHHPVDALPSAHATDEIGDLSRRFSSVLRQLGEYNAYLRTLASKLSHELRTPLTIVTSSLENLEHENLDDSALAYVHRASDGATRLRGILSAMSEANRVEELMQHAEPEVFDLNAALRITIDTYRTAYPDRQFDFTAIQDAVLVNGSPELLTQMLDKLVDNAVSFSMDDDRIEIELAHGEHLMLSVSNPGPPLPEHMRAQLFDSMVSLRDSKTSRHLGLGLYVARLIAEGHGGSIAAENTPVGVKFSISLPAIATQRTGS